MILVSACLCGVNCKYNGKNNLNEEMLELLKKGEVLLVCPEQMGGLETPRNPSEIKIINNEVKVFMKDGRDVTENYKKGAAIGGDKFGNYEGLLPKKSGRKYYECTV